MGSRFRIIHSVYKHSGWEEERCTVRNERIVLCAEITQNTAWCLYTSKFMKVKNYYAAQMHPQCNSEQISKELNDKIYKKIACMHATEVVLVNCILHVYTQLYN